MAIRITSKRDGFRRCGIEHVGTVVYPDKHFTKEELKRLKEEPMLIVEQVKDEPKEDGGKGGQMGGGK